MILMKDKTLKRKKPEPRLSMASYEKYNCYSQIRRIPKSESLALALPVIMKHTDDGVLSPA